MNKDHENITNQRCFSRSSNGDSTKCHNHANDEDHCIIGKDEATNDNPWSLLGISENDIHSVLNAYDLGTARQTETDGCSKKKNQGTTKRSKAKRQRDSPITNSTSTTRKKVKGIEMSVRNVPKASTSGPPVTSNTPYKSNRKLPMRTTTNASKTTTNVPIRTRLRDQEQQPTQPQPQPQPRHRSSLQLSTHSEDHDADADALQSITSSTSFLNHCNDSRNHNKNKNTNDQISTNVPSKNHFMTPTTTITKNSGIAPAETVVTSSSFTSNHFNNMIHNNSNNNNIMMDKNPIQTHHTYGPPPPPHQHHCHHPPQFVHRQQYPNNDCPPSVEYYPQQQQRQPPQYLNCHRRTSNFLTAELLELQLQYQKSIQRITNSMMQSHRTKCILQRNGTTTTSSSSLLRRRSSLTVASYSSNGGQSHSNIYHNRSYNHHHHHPLQDQEQQQQQRRKSSLQFSNKTIIIPNTGTMEYHDNDHFSHPNDEGGLPMTDHYQEDTPCQHQMDETNVVDVRSTIQSDASSIMSTKHRRGRRPRSSNSSTSNSVSTTKTGTNVKSSSLLLSNVEGHPHVPLQQPDASSSLLPFVQQPQPQMNCIPNHHPLQHPRMMLQPSTNVEVTREMLYHILHSSNHVHQFMNLS